MERKGTSERFTIPARAIENEHLLDIFEENREQYYLELGNIDYDTLQVLLMRKPVPLTMDKENIKALSYKPIQNEGAGHYSAQFNVNSDTKAIVPFIYYMNFDNNNDPMLLFLTYGLLSYRYKNQTRYAPIILIPVMLYFEEDTGYVRMMSEAVENRALLERLNKISKSFKVSHRVGNSLYQYDEYISSFNNKEKDWCVHYENYLTLAKVVYHWKTIDTERFNNAHNIYSALDNEYLFTPQPFVKPSLLNKRTNYSLYMNESFNAKQRRILMSALDGNTLAITGYSGSGKSSVLRAIAINALSRKKKVLYVSPLEPTLWSFEKELKEAGLKDCYVTHNPYEGKVEIKPNLQYNAHVLKELYEKSEEFKAKEQQIGQKKQGFSYLEVLTQCALFNQTYEPFPIKDIAHLFYHEDFTLDKGQYVMPELVEIERLMSLNKVYKDSVYHILNRKNINKEEAYEIIYETITSLHANLARLMEKERQLHTQYGFLDITYLNIFRQIIDDWFALDWSLIPASWLKGDFDTHKHTYQSLLRDLTRLHIKEREIEDNYQDLDYHISNIDETLLSLKGPYFKDGDGAKINQLLLHKDEIYGITQKAEKVVLDNLNHDVTALLKDKTYHFTNATITMLEELLSSNTNYLQDLEIILKDDNFKNLYALYHNKNDQVSIQKAYSAFKKDCLALHANNIPLQDYLGFFKLKGNLDEQMTILSTYMMNPSLLDKTHKAYFKTLLKDNKDIFKNHIKDYKNYNAIYLKNMAMIHNLNNKYKIEYNASLERDAESYYNLASEPRILSFLYETIQISLRKINEYTLIKPLLLDVMASLNILNQAYYLGLNYGITEELSSYEDKINWIKGINNYLTPLYAEQSQLQSALKHHDNAVLYEDFLAVKRLKDDIASLKEQLNSSLYKEAFGPLLNTDNPSQIDNKTIDLYMNKFMALVNETSSLEAINEIINHKEDVNSLMEEAQAATKEIITNSGIINHYFKKDIKAVVETSTLEEIYHIMDKLLMPENLEELKGYVSISTILNKLWTQYTHLEKNETDKKSVEVHDLKLMIKEIADSNGGEDFALRLSYQFFTALRQEWETNHPHLLKDMYDSAEPLLEAERLARSHENQKVIYDIIHAHNGNENECVIVSSKLLYKVADKKFDIVIIDDAHAISPMMSPIYEDCQLIVAGDYLNYKAQSEAMISKFDPLHQYVLDYRFKPLARHIELGLEHYRLKNLELNRFGYTPMYEDKKAQYKEITLAPVYYHNEFDGKAMLKQDQKNVMIPRNNLTDFLKVCAEYALEGHMLILGANSSDFAYISANLMYVLTTYYNEKTEDINDCLSLINTKNLTQELNLLKINEVIKPTLHSEADLRIERIDKLTLLTHIVYDVLDHHKSYNILCESIEEEKGIFEMLYALFLERVKTLGEAIAYQHQYIYFSHLSVTAIAADKTVLICHDYEHISAKDKIANMLTQLLFNSPEIILFDDTTNRKQSSFIEARHYEFLGMLKGICELKDFGEDESFFDPLMSFDTHNRGQVINEKLPDNILLERIKDVIETTGGKAYLAQKPLDLYVIPKGSEKVYSVLVISPSFSDHLSLMNDYRDVMNQIKNVQIIKIDDLAKDLEKTVLMCLKKMEDNHA